MSIDVVLDFVNPLHCRAATLLKTAGHWMPAGTVLADAAAATFLAGTPVPPQLTVLCPHRMRAAPPVVYRKALVPENDVMRVRGCAVTTPLRTITDLLRYDPEPEWEERMMTLAARYSVRRDDVLLSLLGLYRQRNVARASARLNQLPVLPWM